MAALDLLSGWDAPRAAAGVVGVVGDERRSVMAGEGDTSLRSSWASVTKLLTALAVLVAVEEGTVSLDDPAGPPGGSVSHLLAHASGLAFDEDRILAPPGERRICSNRGFEELADVVAGRADMPFDRYLREAVLEPLGLDGTRLEGSPAAGCVGPLDDLLRVGSELLAPTLVAPDTLRLATTVAFPGLDGELPGFGRQTPMDWGLGFELRGHKSPHWTGRSNSPATFGHFGASGAFLWVDPDAGLACAVLSGRRFGPWAVQAWPALADAVLDDA